jgi:hypothetical protein
VSDFLDDRRKEITAEAVGSTVGSAVSDVGSAAVVAVTSRRGPERQRGSGTGKKGPGRPRGSGEGARNASVAPSKVGRPKGKVGRRKGSGARSAQALSFVQ